MTQQRSNDEIRADLAQCRKQPLHMIAGGAYKGTTYTAEALVRIFDDVAPLLARVSELEQENARLRSEQRDDLDDYAVDELPKALRQLSAAEQRAERAEALAVEKCQRVAAAVRAARAAGPAGLSLQEEQE